MRIYFSTCVDSTGEGRLVAASSKKQLKSKKDAIIAVDGYLQHPFIDFHENIPISKVGMVRAVELGAALVPK